MFKWRFRFYGILNSIPKPFIVQFPGIPYFPVKRVPQPLNLWEPCATDKMWLESFMMQILNLNVRSLDKVEILMFLEISSWRGD